MSLPCRHFASWSLALLMAELALSSCEPHLVERRFQPEFELSGVAVDPLGSGVARNRTRHTWGSLGEDLSPCVSDDGETLYFSTSRFSEGFDIVSKSLHGYTLSFLTNGRDNDIHPAISPDGATLAFASDRSGHWSLYLLETRPRGKLEHLDLAHVDMLGPRWSPDGKKLVYFRRGLTVDRWEVWTVDLDLRTQSYVTEGLFPDWSPSGEWIVFQRARQRGESWYSIWRVHPDGRRLTDLLSGRNDTWGATHPVWSPDGEWIVFTAVGKNQGAMETALKRSFAGESDLYLLSVQGAKLIDLTGDRSGVSEWNPRFGKDWRIYFSADEEGATRVWSMASGLGGQRSEVRGQKSEVRG